MRIKTSFYSLDWEGHRYSNLQTETLDWKDMQEAKDCYHICKTEIVSMEVVTTCQNCKNGQVDDSDSEFVHAFFVTCTCCNGDYLNCPTCQTDEGTGNDAADLLAGMRG